MPFLSNGREHAMQRTSAFQILAGMLVCALLVSGCDTFNEANDELASEIRQRVEDRRQQWEDQNIEDYQLIYSQQLGDVIVDSVEVFVRSQEVDSIATSKDIPDDDILVGTVESFFERIEARIGEDDSRFTADFDPDRGFPTRYTADFENGRESETVLTTALVDSVASTE